MRLCTLDACQRAVANTLGFRVQRLREHFITASGTQGR